MSVDAQFAEGMLFYQRGDYGQARERFAIAVERDDLLAIEWLAMLYHRGLGGAVDDRKGTGILRRGAELGKASLQYQLALCYRDGRGVAADPQEAFAWAERGARQRIPSMPNAAWLLGTFYRDGFGVGRDLAAAAQWLRWSAECGSVLAQRDLARLLLEWAPEGMDPAQHRQREEEAIHWSVTAFCQEGGEPAAGEYEEAMRAAVVRSAKAGNGEAAYWLATSALGARGGGSAEAIEWLRLGAAAGHLPSKVYLGTMLANGIGGAADEGAAEALFQEVVEAVAA